MNMKQGLGGQWKSPSHLKNEVRFKLLILLPSFREDIKQARKDLGIPKNGFDNDRSFEQWYKNTPQNKPDQAIVDIGKRYKLPLNFYSISNPFRGLYPYITKGEVKPPSNNWGINLGPGELRRGEKTSISITTFAPLSRRELEEAKNALEGLQKHYFPKSITVDSRVKKQFDRDFEIYERLVVERAKKPQLRKKYRPGSYIDVAAKSGRLSPEEMRKLERKHKDKIDFEFDAETSRKVAEELDMTKAAVRGVIRRMRGYIKAYFGEEYLER